MKRKLTAMCALLVLLALTPAAYSTECMIYNFSTATYFPGYGFACAGYGISCTECWDSSTGDSCIANGSQPCEPGPLHQN
jgi:hypothetical protein